MVIRAVEKNKTRVDGEGLISSGVIRESFTDGVTFYKDLKEVREQDLEIRGKAVQRSMQCEPLCGRIWCLRSRQGSSVVGAK